jgi:multicomponent Na+:H+ antiporter subunit A
MLVLMRVLQHPFDPRLSTFFAEHSVEIAHGRNIVNVILVDFRGLDTLGEISVVMAAGVAVMVLLAGRMPSPSTGERPKRSRTRQVTQRVAT